MCVRERVIEREWVEGEEREGRNKVIDERVIR